MRPDGRTSFSIIQAASDSGDADALMFFLFDLLFLNGEDLTGLPLSDRRARLAIVISRVGPALQYSDHQLGRGPTFYAEACKLGLEGIGSKRGGARYVPRDRGLSVETKFVNREEFVIVGCRDPEGARPYLGALLLAYYDDSDRLVYTGRAGAGVRDAELERLWRRFQPVADQKDAPGRTAVANQPIWVWVGALAGASGPTGTRRSRSSF